MPDFLSTTANKHHLESTSKVNPFHVNNFAVQPKSENSTPASKAELWESYQQAKQLNQSGVNRSSVPIQAKLTIGQPGDKYEQEADSVADRVMAMPEPKLSTSTVPNSVQTRSIQPIQKVSNDTKEDTTEESKQEGSEDQIQTKEAISQTPEITTTSAKVAEIPNEPSIQRDSPSNLPPIPNYQLTMPSLGQPQDPSSRYNLGGDLSLHLDPQFQSTMQQVQEQVTPTTIRTALGQIKLNVPVSGTPAPAANPLAMPSQPAPTASPPVPAGDGPDQTRAADAGDLMDTILAIPSIETAIDSLKTQASDRITQDWQRLNTGEKVLGVSSLVVVGGSLLAGIIANPAARKLALDQLNGKVLPVPKLNWLHLEINTGGENLMLGLHVDVGQLLPSSWGFKASSPNAIGGVPEPEPFSLQRKSDSIEDAPSSSSLEDRLNGSKGGGNPLSDEVRSFMEPRFGADFSGVRVHTGSDAVQMNQDVNAQAFAHGSDVYFGAGKAPGKDALTAHELTHVVQQTGKIQSKQNSVERSESSVTANSTNMLQRDPLPTATPQQASDSVSDRDEALIRAIHLVNKNSLLKIKLPIKAPPAIKVFGGLELKKVEIELDVIGEASIPSLTDKKNTTKISGGYQNTMQHEVDTAKRSTTESQGTILALEAEQKFGSSPIEQMLSFKAGVQSATYTAADSLIPIKQEFKTDFGFGIASEHFSVGIKFTPIAYDSTKKGSDAFKLANISLPITGEFVHKAPGLINIQGTKVDVNLKVKATGSVEIGPDYDKAIQYIAANSPKLMKDFIKATFPKLFEEETDSFIEQYVRSLVETEIQDITHPAGREVIRDLAEKEAMKVIKERQLKIKIAEEANLLITDDLLESLSIKAIKSEVKQIVSPIARNYIRELRPAIINMIKVGWKEFSLRAIARNMAKSLVAGPADFVLLDIQVLYNYFDTIIKDQEMKEFGLRVMACRDNYVSGYVDGLRGAGSSGEAGDGNIEGTTQLLGLKEGGNQFNQILDLHLQDSTVTKEEAILSLKETMPSFSIDRSVIVSKATPKLKKMMLSSYEKQFSGGIMRTLFGFGGDFKSSKEYQNFERYADQYLEADAKNTIRTRLKKGDQETLITLTMLDSTGDRARQFRTEDGRYLVTLSGDTSKYSGWVTDKGIPLEEIYLNQDDADKASSPEGIQAHTLVMKQKLAAGRIMIEGCYNEINLTVSSAKLINTPNDDLQFQEFMRSPEALKMTLQEAGLSFHLLASEQFDKEVTGEEDSYTLYFSISGTISAPTIKNESMSKYQKDIPSKWSDNASLRIGQHLANRRLAAFPKLI